MTDLPHLHHAISHPEPLVTSVGGAPFRGLSPRNDSWRLILDTALDAVIVMNSRGDVVDWNDKATEIFGWSRAEVVGHKIELSISPVSDEDELVFVGFLRDIGGRKRAERQREQHTLKMEVLYRAVSFAAETTSFEGALEVCLESIQKLTGWPIEHVYLPSGTAPVRLLPSPLWCNTRPGKFDALMEATAAASFAEGEGLPGKVWSTGEPVWFSDVGADGQFTDLRAAIAKVHPKPAN